MECLSLSQKGAQFRNKWRRRIKGLLANPGLPGRMVVKTECVCVCVCVCVRLIIWRQTGHTGVLHDIFEQSRVRHTENRQKLCKTGQTNISTSTFQCDVYGTDLQLTVAPVLDCFPPHAYTSVIGDPLRQRLSPLLC